MPVSGTGQGHLSRPSLSSPWSLPLLPPRSLCVGTCRAGKENVSSSKFLGCISSRVGQQSSVTPDMSLGMGGAHVQRERLCVAQSVWGGPRSYPPLIHPFQTRTPTPDRARGPAVDMTESCSTGRRRQHRRSGVDGAGEGRGMVFRVKWGPGHVAQGQWSGVSPRIQSSRKLVGAPAG